MYLKVIELVHFLVHVDADNLLLQVSGKKLLLVGLSLGSNACKNG